MRRWLLTGTLRWWQIALHIGALRDVFVVGDRDLALGAAFALHVGALCDIRVVYDSYATGAAFPNRHYAV